MARNKFDIDEELDEEFNAATIRRLLTYILPHHKKVLFAVAMMLLSSAASLTGPYLVKIALDSAIPQKNVWRLAELSLIYLGFLILSGVCLRQRIKIMTEMGESVIYEIRKDVFETLQKLPFTYYDSRPHGKILIRVTNYVNSLGDLLANGIINLITDLFSLAVIVVFMLLIDVHLSLIALAWMPVLLGVVFLLKNKQRRAWQAVSRKQSNMNAYLHESISGVKVTQSFAREAENANIFRRLNLEYRQEWMPAVRIIFLIWPSIETISVASVLMIYVTGVTWFAGSVSLGTLIAFVGYVWRFWQPITSLGNFYNSLVVAAAYLERIFETIDEQPVVFDHPEAKPLPRIAGHVEFRDVSFGYEPGHPVLHRLNFAAQPGQTIAMVGSTGAGKTTIISLLSRFYNIEQGQVLIDGHDVQRVTLHSLRSQMGIMLQDSFLFSGTIMDNIRYGRLDATDEEVIAAAKAVHAHDFIETLAEQYATQVNERGVRLSVGQRQLISFARTMLADPRILILDEATSSIDTETEIKVQNGIARLLQGRTSFIIAHRLSTIRNADRIFYLEHGNILETGTHDELLNRKGAYYTMYAAQMM
ncbi:ABC transporter transmembrane region [Candidatus Moduliflexus flocculans]|uniref:ABC transporter transmembrane region n=1 Tax=Candidatus Moduliflexus flocculans TaxID=1499966 RepID=A0A0S6VVL5_9BACT|nr:ABC transporter transmembrane region [Candidatus Moduliflexus flocculans]